MFKKYYNLTDRFTKINITNIRDDVGFFIIQVHTYVENVTLSSTTKLNLGSYVIGTNIGLVWDSDNNTALFYLSRNIKVEQSLQILLVISLYDEDGKHYKIKTQNVRLVVASDVVWTLIC